MGPLVLSAQGLSKNKGDDIVITSLKELEPLEELGKGTSGVVSRMLHKPSGQILAVKVFLLCSQLFIILFFQEMVYTFDEASKKQLKIELDTLISCASPYIVRCYNAFYTVSGPFKYL